MMVRLYSEHIWMLAHSLKNSVLRKGNLGVLEGFLLGSLWLAHPRKIMTTLAHGKTAPVLADGSSLLQQRLLSPEQSLSIRHDILLLKSAESSRRKAKVADIAVRSLVVLALVTVGALVFTENINNFLALAIVLPLLFATDASSSIIDKMSAKRAVNLTDLKLYSTVSSMVNAHLFNKSVDQKKNAYLLLLTTGKMIFSAENSYRLLLSGGTDTPHTLSYVVG